MEDISQKANKMERDTDKMENQGKSEISPQNQCSNVGISEKEIRENGGKGIQINNNEFGQRTSAFRLRAHQVLRVETRIIVKYQKS